MWQRQNTDRPPLSSEALLAKAEAYCSRAEHCPQEVRDKLYAWGADSRQVEEILAGLTDNGFVSEERYCRAFAHDKLLFQGWGREKIRAALSARRLPQQVVDETLDGLDEEDYHATLERLRNRKLAELSNEDEDTRREKTVRFLLSRGFSYREIESRE